MIGRALVAARVAVTESSLSKLEQIVEGFLGAGRLSRLAADRGRGFALPAVRAVKNGHSLATSFGETRAVMVCVHSKRAPGSKCTHCAHERRSWPHLVHLLREKICESTSVPQREQRATSRNPGMLGFFAPSDEMRRAPAGAPGARSGRPAPGPWPSWSRRTPFAVVVLIAALLVFAVAHALHGRSWHRSPVWVTVRDAAHSLGRSVAEGKRVCNRNVTGTGSRRPWAIVSPPGGASHAPDSSWLLASALLVALDCCRLARADRRPGGRPSSRTTA